MTGRDPMLIVGGYGYENLGDEAILAGLLELHRGRAITVVSRVPARTTALHGVPAIGIGAALAALRRHRTVLIGGGGLFGAGMGRVGRLLPWYGLAALALGRTVLIDGVGFDPSTPLPVRLPLVRLLRGAAVVTVRDETSRTLLKTWGVAAQRAPDRSAAMPAGSAASGARLLFDAGVDRRRPVVGLCLTAVNDSLAGRVVDAAVDAIDALPEAQFCFLPMSRHPFVAAHDDLRLARRIAARRPQLRIVETRVHPAQMLAAIGQLSAVVGMRYHSLLFAERSGVPYVPVAYAPKVGAWLAERGQVAGAPDGAAWAVALRPHLTWLAPAELAS